MTNANTRIKKAKYRYLPLLSGRPAMHSIPRAYVRRHSNNSNKRQFNVLPTRCAYDHNKLRGRPIKKKVRLYAHLLISRRLLLNSIISTLDILETLDTLDPLDTLDTFDSLDIFSTLQQHV